MLSRRQLRVKVLQALYSYYQTDEPSLSRTERELFSGIEKVYDLYIYKLLLLTEIADYEHVNTQDSQQKYLQTQTDINPDNRLYNNPVIHMIAENPVFKAQVKKRKLSWQADNDLVKKIFLKMKKSDKTKSAVRLSREYQ